MYGDPDDGVGLGIEVCPTPKSQGRDGVLLNKVRTPLKVFFAYVGEHAGQMTGPSQDAGCQQPVEFTSLGVRSGS